MTKMTAEQVAAECKRLAWLLDTGGTVGDTSEAYGLRVAADLIREHLSESDDQRRERFESWRLAHGDTPVTLRQKHDDGTYRDTALRLMWGSFQAGATWRGETKGGET